MAEQMEIFPAAPREVLGAPGASVAYYPGVLGPDAAARLFAALQRHTPWRSEEMWMYDHMVDVPRLVASYSQDVPLPPDLAAAKRMVESALRERFDGIALNFYRDGSDSVAWHNDRTEELADRSTVALLSLGETRRMLLRPKKPPRKTLGVDLAPGRVLAMTGRGTSPRSRSSASRAATAYGRRMAQRFALDLAPVQRRVLSALAMLEREGAVKRRDGNIYALAR